MQSHLHRKRTSNHFQRRHGARDIGSRKTQTRRIIKPQPFEVSGIKVEHFHPAIIDRHGSLQPGREIFGAYSEDGEWGAEGQVRAPSDDLAEPGWNDAIAGEAASIEISPEERQRQREKAQSAAAEREAIIKAEQRRRFETLTGKPFDEE